MARRQWVHPKFLISRFLVPRLNRKLFFFAILTAVPKLLFCWEGARSEEEPWSRRHERGLPGSVLSLDTPPHSSQLCDWTLQLKLYIKVLWSITWFKYIFIVGLNNNFFLWFPSITFVMYIIKIREETLLTSFINFPLSHVWLITPDRRIWVKSWTWNFEPKYNYSCAEEQPWSYCGLFYEVTIRIS